MKAILKIGMFVFVLSFFGLASFTTPNDSTVALKNQDEKVIMGTYDGREDYGYNFIYKTSDDEERTMTFQIVEADVLKVYNLDPESFIGAQFRITYTITTETILDDNDFEEEVETKTIIRLDIID